MFTDDQNDVGSRILLFAMLVSIQPAHGESFPYVK